MNINDTDWILYDGQKPNNEYIDISSCDESKIRNIQGKDYGIVAAIYRYDGEFDVTQMKTGDVQTEDTTTIINHLQSEAIPSSRLNNISFNTTEQDCINTDANTNYKSNANVDDKFTQNTKMGNITNKKEECKDNIKKRIGIVRINQTTRVIDP